MQGQRYRCVEHDRRGVPVRRFVAVWIPEMELLFHWDLPARLRRVVRVSKFPFSGGNYSAVFEGSCEVRYEEIKAARKYLQQREHIDKSREAIQLAQRRFEERHRRNEHRLQAALRGLVR